MAVKTDRLTRTFTRFIEQQQVFFVSTAAPAGRVNVSPKGLDCLRVLSDQQIVWLSVTGSGNETAAHLLQSPRMTLMFCAFNGPHMILRVYGAARVFHPRDPEWSSHCRLFPDYAGARNIFSLQIELVTTSCGSGVPVMTLARSRAETDLLPYFEEMGQTGVADFWRRRNQFSIDGTPTGIFTD